MHRYILGFQHYSVDGSTAMPSGYSPGSAVHYLAHSAKLPTGLYILLALIFFFFLFYFLSLTISRRQIISGSARLIFAIFSPNESVLGADDRPGPLFSISQRTLPWQLILWKNDKLHTFVALWHLATEWDIATSICASTAQVMPVYRVKISWNSVQ